MRIRVGHDEHVYGDIGVAPDGTFTFHPVDPHHAEALRRVAETYARQLEDEDGATPESLAKVTAEDVLKRAVDRMTAKHFWAVEVKGPDKPVTDAEAHREFDRMLAEADARGDHAAAAKLRAALHSAPQWAKFKATLAMRPRETPAK